MKRPANYLGIFFFAWVCCFLLGSWYTPTFKSNSFLIVLDAGHGGKDPGCSGKFTQEKNITLSVAQKLAKLFKEKDPSVRIELTRDSDAFVGLQERAKLANARKADIFVSIHCNANKNINITGSETYAMGVHKADAHLDVMMAENSVILLEEDHQTKYEGFDPKSAEAYIIFKLQQHAFLKQSLELAHKIEHHFTTETKRQSRGVKQAGFLVLWKTSMPAVLVELGFLTNPEEEKFLASHEGQRYIVNAIYKAIQEYRKSS
ncbi:MAG: N-acetylmuramoyl-L-alanine amidase [Bacteroidia bacterium]|nr:N-acetylmuramoyl-L-alanine amidase [Bacteroidia bacterium]MDW8158348.1 N-acetylmuramoyl-L-alanine amidase [Bacteroidia bacterium]